MIVSSPVNYKWVMIGIGLLLGIFLFIWKSKSTYVQDLYKLMGIGKLPQPSEETPQTLKLEEPTILPNADVKEPFAVRADRPKENEEDKDDDDDEFV